MTQRGECLDDSGLEPVRVPEGRRALLARVGKVVLSAALVLTGCLSPTVPLPPPSRPNVFAPDDSGNVRVVGGVQSRATAFVHNARTDQIVGEVTGVDGRYDLVIGGEIGDTLFVWQSYNTEESAPIEVVVPSENPPNGDLPPESMGGAASE